MRTLLLLIAFSTTCAFAQIPNPGFESWGGIWQLEPEGWSTPNLPATAVVTQDANAFEGEFAMRVDAVPDGIGKYGWAECVVPIDYIPASLDFYVKAGTEFGGVSVRIEFYNNENLFNSAEWNSGQPIEAWSLVSIPLSQDEPGLTHAVIRVEAQVGDLVAGDAWISMDAMGFGGPLNEHNRAHSELLAYPNPARDHINIAGLEPRSTIRLMNITGTLVKERSTNEISIKMPLDDLERGLYILCIENALGSIQTRKLVIE